MYTSLFQSMIKPKARNSRANEISDGNDVLLSIDSWFRLGRSTQSSLMCLCIWMKISEALKSKNGSEQNETRQRYLCRRLFSTQAVEYFRSFKSMDTQKKKQKNSTVRIWRAPVWKERERANNNIEIFSGYLRQSRIKVSIDEIDNVDEEELSARLSIFEGEMVVSESWFVLGDWSSRAKNTVRRINGVTIETLTGIDVSMGSFSNPFDWIRIAVTLNFDSMQ